MVRRRRREPARRIALATADSWQWFTETGKTRAPSWRNEVTLRSVEMFTEYEPVSYLPYISPTPLLLLVAAATTSPVELAIAAYDKAHSPALVSCPTVISTLHKRLRPAASGPRDWFAAAGASARRHGRAGALGPRRQAEPSRAGPLAAVEAFYVG